MKEFECFEWFEWFGPSPIEPFDPGPDYVHALPDPDVRVVVDGGRAAGVRFRVRS